MKTATATYTAPKDDSKVVEMGGVTFFDGQAVTLNSDEHAHLINKLPGNHHFNIEVGEDDGKTKKRGRPTNAEREARAAESSQGEQT